ncbi:hypothetical protein [Pelagibius marinus]|uniref:hypothetical protein n=1 Tax=Pelagibius marinus TaxID=2762760 RepID=UPI001872E567|nr:hypothetical protein [Pelagibius marinus]
MISSAFRPAAGVVVLSFSALLTACAYQGDIDNPATLKATWFSYLNGDDIRANCVEGSGRRYRLVYNADYNEQIRSYEVIDQGPQGASLITRVQGPSGLRFSQLRLSDPLGWARWTKSVTPLSLDMVERLDAALEASSAFGPAPSGLQLFSKETYWISSLCRDGQFFFNAWRFPSPRYEAVSFDELLFSLDETGVAVRQPVAVPSTAAAKANVPRVRHASDETGSFFNVKVGENGLVGQQGS